MTHILNNGNREIVGDWIGVVDLEYSTAEKIQMETLIQKKPFILKATTYDGFEPFCGMLTFLFKSFSEHYGLIKDEQDQNDHNQYQFLKEKIEFYEKEQDKLLMVKNFF